MEYPLSCIMASDRTEYLYMLQERLRILHNHFVEWRDKGLTAAEYASFIPAAIQKVFPYQPQISMDIWKEFRDKEFRPRSDSINEDLLKYRVALKNSLRWSIDVGEIPKWDRG